MIGPSSTFIIQYSPHQKDTDNFKVSVEQLELNSAFYSLCGRRAPHRTLHYRILFWVWCGRWVCAEDNTTPWCERAPPNVNVISRFNVSIWKNSIVVVWSARQTPERARTPELSNLRTTPNRSNRVSRGLSSTTPVTVTWSHRCQSPVSEHALFDRSHLLVFTYYVVGYKYSKRHHLVVYASPF